MKMLSQYHWCVLDLAYVGDIEPVDEKTVTTFALKGADHRAKEGQKKSRIKTHG